MSEHIPDEILAATIYLAQQDKENLDTIDKSGQVFSQSKEINTQSY